MTQSPQNQAGQNMGGRGQGAAAEGLDLSAVRNRPAQAAGGAQAGGAQPGPDQVAVPDLVFDVTEATFNDVVQLSAEVPVVVDLWADWCGPCKQLSPVIERVVRSYNGKLVLAKVDVDANPQLQQVFQVQSIPAIVAIVAGQPVPLFQGAQPEPQVKQVMDQLVALAAQQGLTKTAVPAGAQEPEPQGPAHPDAIAALEAGDIDGAARIYKAALAQAPADEEARVGLARTGLLARTRDLDLNAVRQASADDPRSVEAALQTADLDIAGGHVDDGFARLLTLLPALTGDDKEAVRVRLLELFEVVGAADPRVVKARARLMRALF